MFLVFGGSLVKLYHLIVLINQGLVTISIVIIVANKVSCDQAYIKSGKALGTRLNFSKIKKNPDRPTDPTHKHKVGWRQINNV